MMRDGRQRIKRLFKEQQSTFEMTSDEGEEDYLHRIGKVKRIRIEDSDNSPHALTDVRDHQPSSSKDRLVTARDNVVANTTTTRSVDPSSEGSVAPTPSSSSVSVAQPLSISLLAAATSKHSAHTPPLKVAKRGATEGSHYLKAKHDTASVSSSPAPQSRESTPEPDPEPKRKASTRKRADEPSAAALAKTRRATERAEKEAKKQRIAERKKIEAEERKLTPREFAALLPAKFGAGTAPKLVLKDRVVLYVHIDRGRASDQTRERLKILAKYGATVALDYDPERLTHMIADGDARQIGTVLRTCGVKSLGDIPPKIKIMTWEWICTAITNGQPVIPEHEIFFEAFAERIPDFKAKPKRGKTQSKASSTVSEALLDRFSNHENENTSDEERRENWPSRNSTRTSLHDRVDGGASSSRTLPTQRAATSTVDPADPLAEFYDIAAESSESENEENRRLQLEFLRDGKPMLTGFQCDNAGATSGPPSPNDDIIEKLRELMELHGGRPTEEDKWRAFTYVIGLLKRRPTRIRSHEEACSLPGIGPKTAKKIMEIIDTGELSRIKTERAGGATIMMMFRGIYGVGGSTALKWYALGARTLDDIRRGRFGITLMHGQEIGLAHYNDLNERMPRSEASEIFEKVKTRALAIDNKLMIEIMGSYRRYLILKRYDYEPLTVASGAETCGDIDILITRPTDDGKTHSGVLRKLLHVLHRDFILSEDLGMPDDLDDLEGKYMGICRKDGLSKRRRIDILAIPYICWGAALVYFTGDDIFNRSMRLKANKMGYSLNQRGLYKGVVRNPTKRSEKLHVGTLVASRTEQDIFAALGVPWQEPHQRIRR